MLAVYPTWLGRAYWSQQAIGAFVILHVSVAVFTAIAIGLSFSVSSTEAIIGIAFGLTSPLMVGAHYLWYRRTRTSFPLRKRGELKDARRQIQFVLRQSDVLMRDIHETRREMQDAVALFRTKGVDTSDLENVLSHMQAQLDDLASVRASAEAGLSRIETRLAKPNYDRGLSDEEAMIPAALINSQMEAMATMEQATRALRRQALHPR